MDLIKKKTQKSLWQVSNLGAAMKDVLENKMTLREAAKNWKIPKSTLFDHIRGKSKHSGDKKITGRQPVFPEAVEEQLVAYIKDFADNLFGLTATDIRKFAYQVAEKNGISHNFDKDAMIAGKKWFSGFMRRNPDLSILVPEKLSYARIMGFTAEAADTFYSILERVCVENNITASTIFNMDESGFGTVMNKAPKVVAQKGTRHLSTVASGERGTNTTVVACMSAAGFWVPPMIIFKGIRIKDDYKIGNVPGGIVAASESGFINTELFIIWLQFFIDVVKPTQQKPVVLVLDGHTSHTKCIDALDMAKANGVILIQLPAHCTHRMQPLDVGFFYPLGKAYATEVTKWQKNNPGIQYTTRQFCSVFSKAYEAKANIEVARKAFETSGIWPVNREVFDTTDFARLAFCKQIANTEQTETNLVTGAFGSKSMEYGCDLLQIDVSSEPADGRKQVPPKNLAPNCTITSEHVDAEACGSSFDPILEDIATSHNSNYLDDGHQQVQTKFPTPPCTITWEQATAAACGLNIVQNLRVISTFCDSSGLNDARQLIQPSSNCTLTSDQAAAAACGLSIAQNLRVLANFNRSGSGLPQLQLNKTGPICSAISAPAATESVLTSSQNLGDLEMVRDLNGLSDKCQAKLPSTVPSDPVTALTRCLDVKSGLPVPLSEIMPLPTIRNKTQKVAAPPAIELTSSIYISGLKEKNRIKEEKEKAKLEAQAARILAKKVREDKKMEEKKAKEEKKICQQLAKEKKRLEAERMKEERQRKKTEKNSKKRSREDVSADDMKPKIIKK